MHKHNAQLEQHDMLRSPSVHEQHAGVPCSVGASPQAAAPASHLHPSPMLSAAFCSAGSTAGTAGTARGSPPYSPRVVNFPELPAQELLRTLSDAISLHLLSGHEGM
jgi:hypothetical protein